MSTNFTGDPLSDQRIAEHAVRLRHFHGLGDLDVPNMVALLEQDTILTRFGIKQFTYKVVPDLELGGDEAITLITKNSVWLRISKTTSDRVLALDRRARWTVAHEFGHGALHKNAEPLARAAHTTIKRVVPAFVSVERQADVFASAYLVTDAMAERANSPADLAAACVISAQAANIRWEAEQTRRNRDRIQAGFRALREELRSAGRPPTQTGSNSLICPVCAQRSLEMIGGKYVCRGPCKRMFEGFPDGDGPIV